MGYTHYFHQARSFTQAEWSAITTAAKLLLVDPILGDSDGTGKPFIGKEEIVFNGLANDSHETFVLHKSKGEEFNCCKTAAKPYDKYVCAMLITADTLAPGALTVESDGQLSEWAPGIKLASQFVDVNMFKL